ncbi:putative toxin-antitoxin system toxin component, PIN family [Magnetovirga frankeli]|uniref:putative toxin-antitoxin system toxin component, PIN family n=1 Tax=Magnetovirga frankeli TaxID=947516 RepID=UPI0012941233|nr:putative toxin-antitoxin system toxin component, PIN family [gamma proteobacterium SS-5]
MKVVVDTNVFVSALRSRTGASRALLRACLSGGLHPCISLALFAEYRDVMGRAALFVGCPINEDKRAALLDAFLSVCQMTEVYYLWRPNLTDEADNHLIELAVAAQAEVVVTHNRSDFRQGQLRFPGIHIRSPAELLKEAF